MKTSKFQKAMEVIGLICLIAATFYIVVSWNFINNSVPVHFDFKGVADKYGSKNSIIFLLVIAWVIYVLLFIVTRLPKAWNMPVEVKEGNRERLYALTGNMIALEKLYMALFFSYMAVASAFSKNLDFKIVTAFMLLIFGTVIVYVIKMLKIQ